MKDNVKNWVGKIGAFGSVATVALVSSAHAAIDPASVITAITAAETSTESIMAKGLTLAVLFLGFKLLKRAIARV